MKNLGRGAHYTINQSYSDNSCPDISGTKLVFVACDNYGFGYANIYCADLKTGTGEKILPSDQNQENPKISGYRVVWEQNNSIYLKNIVTNQWGKVFNSTQQQSHPDISGTRIV